MVMIAMEGVKTMSDLIRRADALAYPIRLDHYDREHGNLHFVLGIESVMEYIEALPSAEAEWIPCSERLPNNDGCVLVTIDDGIEFGKYEDGSWSIWVCEHWDKWDAKGTIAWMPLPKPYKGGDDE